MRDEEKHPLTTPGGRYYGLLLYVGNCRISVRDIESIIRVFLAKFGNSVSLGGITVKVNNNNSEMLTITWASSAGIERSDFEVLHEQLRKYVHEI
jgi:hypothetical protein